MSSGLAPLPVDAVLPAVIDALRTRGRVVLEAPPGAGKTTRVPPAIAAAFPDGQIWVLEPRRLAARTAARRVAAEQGEVLGQRIGYRVRFDDQTSRSTRIIYATEGVLQERLRRDEDLAGVAAIVFDEFHERHLDGDVVLGLALRLAQRRPLLLCVMSATLDAGPIAAHLDAPRVTSDGRRFPIEIRYAPPQLDGGREEPLERSIARAARACLLESAGDVLCFLPGAREIRAAERVLGERAGGEAIDVVPLHGDLAPDAQDRAIRPGPRRKIILSTNVAETSVTIEGVTAVVDSGLARVASHSPWSGLPMLAVKRVSRASAAQRAGRAGRLGPGRCVRLYSAHDHDTRAEHELPEIERADLAAVLLLFAEQGIDERQFPWLSAPPAASLATARELLLRLGAIEPGAIERGAVLTPTARGRQMARLPLHPRAAALLLSADAAGARSGGTLVAALLGQGGERLGPRAARQKDVDAAADLLEEVERIRAVTVRDRIDFDRARHEGLDLGRVAEVDRARKQLEGLIGRLGAGAPTQLAPGSVAEETVLLRALLAAFPDRVARRLKPRQSELAFSEGGSGKLDMQSVVRSADLLIAYDVTERVGQVPGARGAGGARHASSRWASSGGASSGGDGVVVRGASRVLPDWLLDDYLERIEDCVEYEWNRQAERVDEVRRLRYGAITIDESRAPARLTGEGRHGDGAQPAGDEVDAKAQAIGAVLAEALGEALRAGGGRLTEMREELGRALDRVAFLSVALPELALTAPPQLEDGSEEARQALGRLFTAACTGATRFDEIAGLSARSLVSASLPAAAAARLERDAPEFISLPSRPRIRVEYPRGQPPFVASRLQDFFGMKVGPKLAGGRVPLTLHLLAPNKRAVQVTQDLEGFWARHYPQLRRELGRRYPRHSWPEDPLRPDVVS